MVGIGALRLLRVNTFSSEHPNESVTITEKIPELMLRGCYHFDKGYVYFRSVDGRLLLGGARNIDHDFIGSSIYWPLLES